MLLTVTFTVLSFLLSTIAYTDTNLYSTKLITAASFILSSAYVVDINL